jgi:hypothetical protein
MSRIGRIAGLAIACVVCAHWPQASAQTAAGPRTKVDVTYRQPTAKYAAVAAAMTKSQLLENLSRFLAPLRFPHELHLIAEAKRSTAKSGLLVRQWIKPRRWSESACFESSVNACRQRSSAGPTRLDKKWRTAASYRSVGERFVLLCSWLLKRGRSRPIVDVLWN